MNPSGSDKERSRLERLKNQEVWKGNFSLVKQFAQNFGVSAHEQMWSKFSCKVPTSATGVADFGGGGKHTKPDCLVPETCMVIEFKPNRPRAIAHGNSQAAAYKGLLQRFYTKHVENQTVPEPRFGGREVIDTLKARCSTGNDISLIPSVATYDVCEMKYECTN